MVGPRRGSGGNRRGRGRGKRRRITYTEVEEEEQVEDMTHFSHLTPQPHPHPHPRPRPAAHQFSTPKIIRTPDDFETFTSPCTHGGSTLIRRVIESENAHTRSEQLTQSTHTSGRRFSPLVLRTLDLEDHHHSRPRLEVGFSNSTLQGAQEQNDVETPLYLSSNLNKSNNTENKNAMNDVFEGALVASGTENNTTLQLENSDSLTEVLAVDLPIVDSHEYNSEESHHPSPTDIHENVGSSSTNNGSKQMVFEKSKTLPSSSLNTTQIVEEMGFCKNVEADSMGAESVNALVCLKGYNYKVKAHHVGLLTSILSKYGDIGANCSMESVTFRSFCMEHVCEIVQTLKNTNLKVMCKKELQSMMALVSDLEKERVDVGWLRKRLDDIFEAEKAIVELGESSNLKKLHGEQVTKVETIKEKLEEYKRGIVDLQKKVNLAELDLSVAETQVSETENSISGVKAKLKYVYKLESLAHGLL